MCLALFVDVLTRNWRTFPANLQALLANGLEVRVIDRPCQKQIPGVMSRRLGVQEFAESNLDVSSPESRMSFRRLTVRPSEERDDARCSCDDCPKRQPSRSRFTPESAPSLAMVSSVRSQRHHPSENHSGWFG